VILVCTSVKLDYEVWSRSELLSPILESRKNGEMSFDCQSSRRHNTARGIGCPALHLPPDSPAVSRHEMVGVYSLCCIDTNADVR
jgi:hypothetical protein